MIACANCAVKDWIEQRVQIYLFAKPNGRTSRFVNVSSQQVHGESEGIQGYETEESKNNSGEPPPAASCSYYKKDDCLCIGEPDKVDKILGVQHYIAAWPKIPIEELHSSSVQHPHHLCMRWLLHSRRVPKDDTRFKNSPESDDATASHEAEYGEQPPCALQDALE